MADTGWHLLQASVKQACSQAMSRVEVELHMQESNRNHLRDFVDIAGPLGVSHFLILTATENAAYLRLAKTPRVST